MSGARILLIDNYDSFTYNLAQAFLVLGADMIVRRNDEISVAEARALAPSHVCISPGPGVPSAAGVSMEMIKAFAGAAPVLGVCLGHQALVEVFGGKIVRAGKPIHGKVSMVSHDKSGLFAGMPDSFEAGRYHSLIAERASLPDVLDVSAFTGDEIMGVRHRTLNVEGVQFHPESVLTPQGDILLANFLKFSGGARTI